MKHQQVVGLLLMAISFTLCTVTLANHCPDSAVAVPNATAPNHSSSTKSPRCPDPNQEYVDCASVCPRTCSNWWNEVTCLACRPGCACKGDLVLNKHNRCVPVSKCPKPACDDPHRKFTEHGSVCPPACPGVNDGKKCTYQFVAGCFCRKGRLEDGNGNCVHPSSCPAPVCDDSRREFNDCGTACPPSCQNLNETAIICTKQCVSECFCKYPYVEDNSGNCVYPSECPEPECSDPNKHYESCGTACPTTCSNKDALIRCTDNCVSGCFCNEGLVEDDNGKCIKPSDCPNTQCTDPDRVYNECGSACPPKCDTLGRNPVPCIDICVAGCFCRDGLVEDSNGNCISPEDCQKCKDPNRYHTNCGTACPITCKNWWHYDDVICTDQCVKGCFCRDGLVEDEHGNCVETSKCPQPVCKDKNRVFNECGSSCPDSCKNINEPNRVCTLQCVSDCFCKYPLVEDGNGNCINRTRCPNKTCEDPNKYYTECGSGCTPTCKNRCNPIFCPAVCIKGCFCLPWLIDNGDGKCIDPKDCPKDACKCEGNAVWTENGTCDGTCDNPSPVCTQDTKPGCFCRPGDVRNNLDICIPRRTCPKSSESSE